MVAVVLILFAGQVAFAQEFTGSNYKILDPVMHPGGYSTSAHYQLSSSISQLGAEISSGTSYGTKAGFLYYPFVTTPAVTGTAGDTQAILSWTAGVGLLGWNVSGYKIGLATASGGPYTYSGSVGNVLTSTRTGLLNGTNYYFVVLPLDSFGNTIATSSEVALLPTASSSTQAPSSNNGGGGGQIGLEVSFSGSGYPNSKVYILQDAVVRGMQVADSSGVFDFKLTGLSSASYLFSLYGEDKNGERSPLRIVPTRVRSGGVSVGSLLLPPTLVSDKEAVKQGENITFSGYAAKGALVSIFLGDNGKLLTTITADQNGLYDYTLNTRSFSKVSNESFVIRAKTSLGGLTSPSSIALYFSVGDKNKIREKKTCRYTDLNCDSRVGLVDFSILLYWVDHAPVPPAVDLNDDGKIDLKDFSILIYYWTG